MTQPTAEQLEVTQADRDAAADRLESTIPEKFRNLHPATHTAKAIRKGKMDGHPWVQNYARHRILAIQATEARMAAAVEALEDSKRAVQAFLDMVNVMQRVQALPIPAILETAQHNCPIILQNIDQALAAIRSATDGQG